MEEYPCGNLLARYASENQDFIEDAVGHFELAELGQRNFAAVAQEQRDDVGVRVEAGAFLRHVVRDDDIRAFAREFGARVFRDVVRFGGESDEERDCLFWRGRVRRECRAWARARASCRSLPRFIFLSWRWPAR